VRVDILDRLGTVKIYSVIVCDLVRQVGHCDCIFWECVWIVGTGITL